MISQSAPLYAVLRGTAHATLLLVVAWDYRPPMPLGVTLASTAPGPHSGNAQPLPGEHMATCCYYDDRDEAWRAYQEAADRAALVSNEASPA